MKSMPRLPSLLHRLVWLLTSTAGALAALQHTSPQEAAQEFRSKTEARLAVLSVIQYVGSFRLPRNEGERELCFRDPKL